MCSIKTCLDSWNKSICVYFVTLWKLRVILFDLDSTPTQTDFADNNKQRTKKVTVDSAVSCITALMDRSHQVVKDEVVQLK